MFVAAQNEWQVKEKKEKKERRGKEGGKGNLIWSTDLINKR
jgi:hypothetical protein